VGVEKIKKATRINHGKPTDLAVESEREVIVRKI
jgi:hypothetical protein